MALSDISEKIQQGWPAKGMTLRGGVSRLLNWIPKSADGYKKVELQFTSDDGKRWFTVANGMKRGQAVLWTVPVVTTKTSRLRIIGLDDKGKRTVLETSKPFTVDTGAWETIDMSGFQTETPKKEKE